MLSCLDVGMSKHLADCFNGDSILQGDGRGEGVPSLKPTLYTVSSFQL